MGHKNPITFDLSKKKEVFIVVKNIRLTKNWFVRVFSIIF